MLILESALATNTGATPWESPFPSLYVSQGGSFHKAAEQEFSKQAWTSRFGRQLPTSGSVSKFAWPVNLKTRALSLKSWCLAYNSGKYIHIHESLAEATSPQQRKSACEPCYMARSMGPRYAAESVELHHVAKSDALKARGTSHRFR